MPIFDGLCYLAIKQIKKATGFSSSYLKSKRRGNKRTEEKILANQAR